ncbi:MAG: alpha/beta hydrolase fold domain-containing protein, partial [Cellulomonas sp.]
MPAHEEVAMSGEDEPEDEQGAALVPPPAEAADVVIAELLRGWRTAPGPSAHQVGVEAVRAASRRRSEARPPGPELWRVAGVAVLAVDHRRAPEHPWSAAADDAVAVTRWAFAQAPDLVGTDTVAVGGDSSGGNLAALVCLRLRDAGARVPAAQVLVYPNTDLTFSLPSTREKAT